jgi:succinoglycan biosynthesis protein ExoA
VSADDNVCEEDLRVTPSRISVVMAVRNEAAHIECTLEHLFRAMTASPVEVVELIVADGMSTDRTREIVENKFRESGPSEVSLRLIANQSQYVPGGLNEAISECVGDVISRIDGHADVHPDFFQRTVDAFVESDAAVVGGGQTAISDGSPTCDAICLANQCKWAVGNSYFHYSDRPMSTESVWMGSFKASVLREVGLYDESLVRNQDDDLAFRIRNAGHMVWLDPKIRADYHPRNSFKGLFFQYFGYGRYRLETAIKHRGVSSIRQLAPPLLVLSIGASLVAAPATGWLVVLPVASYLVFLVAIYGWFRSRSKTVGWRGPAAVATMQLAYGSGFLVQTVRRWTRLERTRRAAARRSCGSQQRVEKAETGAPHIPETMDKL